jgi:hypothetical protein
VKEARLMLERETLTRSVFRTTTAQVTCRLSVARAVLKYMQRHGEFVLSEAALDVIIIAHPVRARERENAAFRALADNSGGVWRLGRLVPRAMPPLSRLAVYRPGKHHPFK